MEGTKHKQVPANKPQADAKINVVNIMCFEEEVTLLPRPTALIKFKLN